MTEKQHLDCRPVDPAGSRPRRWKCLDCGQVKGTLTLLMADLTCSGPKKGEEQRIMDAIEGKENGDD